MATTYEGIDVSQWNGNVNFSKVKSTKKFVMIRAGYGKYISQKDPKFESNYKNAVAAGLSVGTYWYSYATNAADAKKEAEVFLSVIKGKKFDMPVAFDIEDATQVKLSRSTLDAIVVAFMTEVEKAGYYASLYSYEAFLNKLSSSTLKRYDIWCANISKTPTLSCGMHQYSFTGNISGCNGAVDLNRTQKDYPTIMKTHGFNGYPKSASNNTATAPAAKKLETSGAKKGDNNSTVYALKLLLLIALNKKIQPYGMDDNSVFGVGTENAVNYILDKNGYAKTGIAGTKFLKLLYELILKAK